MGVAGVSVGDVLNKTINYNFQSNGLSGETLKLCLDFLCSLAPAPPTELIVMGVCCLCISKQELVWVNYFPRVYIKIIGDERPKGLKTSCML